jgi:hypothetical protein
VSADGYELVHFGDGGYYVIGEVIDGVIDRKVHWRRSR